MEDKKILDIAMRNSFLVLFEGGNHEDIMESEDNFFAHNPFAPYSKEFLYNMLDHFIDQEEYEKCITITQTLDEWNSDPTRKKL